MRQIVSIIVVVVFAIFCPERAFAFNLDGVSFPVPQGFVEMETTRASEVAEQSIGQVAVGFSQNNREFVFVSRSPAKGQSLYEFGSFHGSFLGGLAASEKGGSGVPAVRFAKGYSQLMGGRLVYGAVVTGQAAKLGIEEMLVSGPARVALLILVDGENWYQFTYVGRDEGVLAFPEAMSQIKNGLAASGMEDPRDLIQKAQSGFVAGVTPQQDQLATFAASIVGYCGGLNLRECHKRLGEESVMYPKSLSAKKLRFLTERVLQGNQTLLCPAFEEKNLFCIEDWRGSVPPPTPPVAETPVKPSPTPQPAKTQPTPSKGSRTPKATPNDNREETVTTPTPNTTTVLKDYPSTPVTEVEKASGCVYKPQEMDFVKTARVLAQQIQNAGWKYAGKRPFPVVLAAARQENMLTGACYDIIWDIVSELEAALNSIGPGRPSASDAFDWEENPKGVRPFTTFGGSQPMDEKTAWNVARSKNAFGVLVLDKGPGGKLLASILDTGNKEKSWAKVILK